MKKIFLFLILSGISGELWAQTDSVEAPYKKFKSFPPVKLLLPDSVSMFTKDDLPRKKAVMLMLFNPTCEHCRHETEDIIKHIDQFENVQIVMATSMPFDSMRVFRERYELARYKNIVVSQDTHFFLLTYFMINRLPFLAFYNRKKELISVNDGPMSIEKMLEELKK